MTNAGESDLPSAGPHGRVRPSASPVTLLFTDIEGSAALWDRDEVRMSQALARHDALARSAVERYGGDVVKTTDDGILAVFDDASAALTATLQLQQELRGVALATDAPLRVRCGLHRGVVEHRDGDYFGSTVNRAARIMSAAHGGQILLSQAVADSIRDHLPAEVRLRDLGRVRLRDLGTPECIYQAVHPNLRIEFPALRSLETTPYNLALQPTTFVGRDKELSDYQAAIAINREVGDRRSEGIQLGNLGNVYADQGRLEEARAHYEAALAIHRELGHRIVEGYALVNLGLVAEQRERFEEAWDLMQQALAIAREVGNRRFEGMALGALAEVSHVTGRLDETRILLESALPIHRAVGNLRDEGTALGRLGSVLAAQGRMDEGRQQLCEGEAKLRKANNPRELAVLLCARGEVDARVGDIEAARAALEEAQVLAAQLAGTDDSLVGRPIARLRALLSGGNGRVTCSEVH